MYFRVNCGTVKEGKRKLAKVEAEFPWSKLQLSHDLKLTRFFAGIADIHTHNNQNGFQFFFAEDEKSWNCLVRVVK
jgi:hypothetical protein